MHQNAAPSLAAGAIALEPKVAPDEILVVLYIDPETRVTSYRPVVPYGQYRTFVTHLSAHNQCSYDHIDIWLGGVHGQVATGGTITLDHSGVSVMVTLSAEGTEATMIVTNGNNTSAEVPLKVVPTFVQNGAPWTGHDPQIVLPPEK